MGGINVRAMLGCVAVAAGLLVCGCTGGGNVVETISDYCGDKTLVGDTIVPELGEYLTEMVEPAGDYYVAKTRRAKFMFSVYDKDFKLVDTIVGRGQGPDELITGMYFGQSYGDPANPSILVMESSKLRLAEMQIHPFAGISTKVVFPISLGLDPSSAYMVNDSLYAGVNLVINQAAGFFLYNTRSKKIKYADDGFEYDPATAFYVSQRGLAFSADGKMYAEAFYSMPCICIFDSSLQLKKKLFFGEETDPRFISIKERNYGFSAITFHGDRIVALMEEPEGKDNRLIVLSGDGELLGSYAIGKALWFFIDSDRGRIVTTNYNAELDMVVLTTIPLPDELK